MFKKIVLIMLSVLAITSIEALGSIAPVPPKTLVTHGDFFPLPREVYVNFKRLPSETSTELESMLVSYGVNVSKSFFKQFFSPTIVFKPSKSINNVQGEHKVRLSVSYKRILVEYNTPAAALRGVELLVDHIKKRNGIYVVDGVDIIDWFSTKSKPKVSGKAEGFELTDPLISKSFILSSIGKTTKGKSLYLYSTTPERWAIECQTLAGCNENWKTLIAIPHYKVSDIKEIIEAGKSRGVEVLLGVNLLEDSEVFRNATGHSIYSVEGMRFVRAILTEYRDKLGLRKIAVGYVPAGIDEFYLRFMERMSELLGVELLYE